MRKVGSYDDQVEQKTFIQKGHPLKIEHKRISQIKKEEDLSEIPIRSFKYRCSIETISRKKEAKK